MGNEASNGSLVKLRSTNMLDPLDQVTYLNVVEICINIWIHALKKSIWRNYSILERQDGLYNASPSTGPFKMADIGFDGSPISPRLA